LAAEISWTKNVIIMERCKDELQREFYTQPPAQGVLLSEAQDN